jgi:hypothetical protein
MIYHRHPELLIHYALHHALLDQVKELLDEMLCKLPRERDYNAVFGRISDVLTQKYSLAIPALDLRFRFTLFMQEEFESIPKEEWKVTDTAWLNEREQKAKTRLISWIEEGVRESKST